MISFTVVGKPVPQGAVKTFLAGGKARGRHSNTTELQDYRARIAMAAEPAMALSGQVIEDPVRVVVTFFFSRPKSHFGSGRNARILKDSAPLYPGTRPDLSHLVRALEDGLTGVVVRDDSLVVKTESAKEYDPKPRTEVTVEILAATVGTERRRTESLAR